MFWLSTPTAGDALFDLPIAGDNVIVGDMLILTSERFY